MKLSREGAARLGCHEARGFPVSDFEFKPEDFDGCCQNGNNHIALTVEEAKALLRRIPMFQMSADWMHPIEVLKARIEQAEGKR